MQTGFEIIGHIHGEWPALMKRGAAPGHDVRRDWNHPVGRLPLFLGDLVDLGKYRLEVTRLVKGLVAKRRAFCIMGHREYHLAAWRLGV